ncbi:MAG: cytochrome-c oxidase, cbb3-type subunit III [Proteobacteria bacterium]|nr:cytochrome-c oxidase, cbb3-type subunit III [Pseudomonadota bacterium]
MPTKIEKDEITGTDTTGHEWDGIKELNTPLPKWWLWTFYATIVWSIGYFIVYPAWPTLSGHTKGVLGWTQRIEIAERMEEAKAMRAPFVGRIEKASLDQIRSSPDLLNFAMAGGRSVFAENCVPCHGAGGSGAKGYPNLADDSWVWGGTLDDIHTTITYGIRNANNESRIGQMPRFGADGILKPAQIDDVAEYVLSLSKRSTNADAAKRGETVFSENCVACHQEGGTGSTDLGAPNLAANIWIYGGDKATIMETVRNSRAGSMPAWTGRLDDATIKMLAVYVHALGGGK